jgi:hypothetical protein
VGRVSGVPVPSTIADYGILIEGELWVIPDKGEVCLQPGTSSFSAERIMHGATVQRRTRQLLLFWSMACLRPVSIRVVRRKAIGTYDALRDTSGGSHEART